MSSKRKINSSATNINFRPQAESKKWETKGTRPLPNPVTIQETLLTMVIHVCRKIMFFDVKLRVGLYMAGLFLSFIFDVLPFPKSYFSRTDNVFNLYFVKIGWAWTLALTLPFVFLSSFAYCSGNRKMVLMHLSRLGVATAIWFIITKLFSLVEGTFGRCSKGKDVYQTKQTCISNGYFWHSLDISGHIFILLWSTLVIIEEAGVINGWESIKDMIRNESHSRSVDEVDLASAMKKLSDDEFHIVRSSYRKFSPYVKALFISMTILTVIWDIMVVSTILYFHIMIEKIIAGVIAIVMWLLTYKYWYPNIKYPPQQPGFGSFKYMKGVNKEKENLPRNKISTNSFNSKKHGRVMNSQVNFHGIKNPDKDKFSKDDLNLIQEQECSNKSADKINKDEHILQFSSGQDVTTRGQALKNFKLSANKTI